MLTYFHVQCTRPILVAFIGGQRVRFVGCRRGLQDQVHLALQTQRQRTYRSCSQNPGKFWLFPHSNDHFSWTLISCISALNRKYLKPVPCFSFENYGHSMWVPMCHITTIMQICTGNDPHRPNNINNNCSSNACFAVFKNSDWLKILSSQSEGS